MMSGKLTSAGRTIFTELDRARRGYGLGDEPVRDPVGWPKFISSLLFSILWFLVRTAVLLAVAAALTWGVNAWFSWVNGPREGDAEPIWTVMALVTCVFLAVSLAPLGPARRRIAWSHCVIGVAVLAVAIYAAMTAWPLWAACVTVCAAVLAYRTVRYVR